MKKWYEGMSADSDVLLSCRIRLARNIKGYLFSKKMNEQQASDLVQKVLNLTDSFAEHENEKYYSCRVNALRDIDKASMVEWHIISSALAQKNQSTGIIISEDEQVSIMVNEEDHLRIQVTQQGMNLSKALDKANEIDDYFSEQLGYAFDKHYGYLTSCPTTVGTGLRASYLLFLPALSMGGKIEQLAEEISKYGVQIRNIYGESNKSTGHIFEISNKTTLGRSESEIIENLDQITARIMTQERKRREYILSINSEEVEDKVYRSYGVLKYAKKLNTQDSMLMLSQLKLGQDASLIQFTGEFNILKTMMEIRPANIQKLGKKQMSRNERDRYRAHYLNQLIPSIK
ncbi:MAG: ATP--guanido phosphotransferase [Clostridiales bacterium]|nr:ATP--guanido phosphotransferase [Clostridiales bacterium]